MKRNLSLIVWLKTTTPKGARRWCSLRFPHHKHLNYGRGEKRGRRWMKKLFIFINQQYLKKTQITNYYALNLQILTQLGKPILFSEIHHKIQT